MKIVVAEDDVALSTFLVKGLESEGHAVTCAMDGVAALERVEEFEPDLLLLDLGLPRMDGVDVLRTLHERLSTLSVLVLTGRTALVQKIDCLNLGADDYLVKPFSMHELVARCRALSRRRAGVRTGLLTHGDLRLDRITHAVTFCGESVEFTVKEFALLEYLLLQTGRSVSRRELLENVWHMPADAGTNVVDVYVNYLRRKLSAVGAHNIVDTVRGEGYSIGLGRKRPQSSMERGPALVRKVSFIPRVGAA